MSATRRQFLQASGLAAAGMLAPISPAVAAGSASGAQSLLFGINGHPFNTREYDANSTPGVPYSDQVSMMTQMGMDIYRTDINLNASGQALNHQKLLNLYGLMDAAGIQLFPMIYSNYSPDVSEQENYDRGLAQGAGFATSYGHMFTHINLGNEWELFKSLKVGPGLLGDLESHWDMPKTDRAMQWIRGANDGIKTVLPNVKSSVAVAGWFPIWWQQFLLDNVGLDFIDWHWYAEMPGNLDALPVELPNDSILDYLWNEYGLPIWVSETNSRARDTNSDAWNEQRKVNWYDVFYDECLNHPHCEAMIIYELLNEPNKGNFEEANFGMVKFPSFDPEEQDFTDWEWKKLGALLAGKAEVIGHFGSDSEGWVLGLGPEFPGAQGSFVRDNSDARNGTWSGVLTGDFSGGGSYVEIRRNIDLDAQGAQFWVRSADLDGVVIRMTDTTGQVHQQRLSLPPGGQWHELSVSEFDQGVAYSHWDGANDGVWHAPATRVALLLHKGRLLSGDSGQVRFDEVTVTVTVP